MKIVFLALLVMPSLIFSEEWSQEVFEVMIYSCANNFIEQGNFIADSYEFCACTTSKISTILSLEELKEAEKSGDLPVLLKELDLQNDISVTCNAKLVYEFLK